MEKQHKENNMPYTTSGKCVYKKKRDGSRGEKVGCTDGSVKKYLKALYANVDEKLTKEEQEMKLTQEEFASWRPIQFSWIQDLSLLRLAALRQYDR